MNQPMTLLKKRTHEETDFLFNVEEFKKVKSQINSSASDLMRLIKSIPTKLLHAELSPITDKDELISVREVARLLGVNQRTVGKYRERGLLACVQYTERKIMYRKADILSFQNRSFREPKDYLE